MPGTLYVVATPIGNLEDVTLRALRVLREVSLIAAEDTRRTARLLQHYSISTRTTSLHEHNERAKTPSLIGRLRAGDSIALVSDAGTPVISDPGAHLVAAAHRGRNPGRAHSRAERRHGCALGVGSAGATSSSSLAFHQIGRKPEKRGLPSWPTRRASLVFYEAPHRIRTTLEDMLRPSWRSSRSRLGRELTKAHEELVV